MLKEEHSLTALSGLVKVVSTHPQKCVTSVRLLLITVEEVSESTDITGSSHVGGHFLGDGHFSLVFQKGSMSWSYRAAICGVLVVYCTTLGAVINTVKCVLLIVQCLPA